MPKRVEEKRRVPAFVESAMLRSRLVSPPPPFEHDPFDGEEHRRFPRAKISVRFKLWKGEEPDLRFQATLTSDNLSVSGAFLSSTFFLPVGTELRTSFQLGEEEPVQARAVIVREERPDRQGKGRSGFALRFVEFYGQTEVTLARLFLGHQLQEFAKSYLESGRAKSLRSELERVIDALAAWELLKVTATDDVWGLRRGHDER